MTLAACSSGEPFRFFQVPDLLKEIERQHNWSKLATLGMPCFVRCLARTWGCYESWPITKPMWTCGWKVSATWNMSSHELFESHLATAKTWWNLPPWILKSLPFPWPWCQLRRAWILRQPNLVDGSCEVPTGQPNNIFFRTSRFWTLVFWTIRANYPSLDVFQFSDFLWLSRAPKY